MHVAALSQSREARDYPSAAQVLVQGDTQLEHAMLNAGPSM
jgi:hypothetical protein